MKKKEPSVRRRLVVVRLSDEEYRLLQHLQQTTTEPTLSAYLRKVALARPVVVKYRNVSVDDFLRDMLPLQQELRAASENFGRAVDQLQVLGRIPEFRSWLLLHAPARQCLLEKVEQIRGRITQLYELWLHE